MKKTSSKISFFFKRLNVPEIGLKLSFLAFLILLTFSLFQALNSKNKNFGGVIWSDAEGYYMYLPAVFIYNGFEKLPVKTESEIKPYEGTNKYFTKYTCGVAIMQFPFFIAFHLGTKWTGLPATGYSAPYTFSVLLASVCYTFLGLFFLFRSLMRTYQPIISLFTLTCFYLGTNLYYYTVYAGGMSHAYSFFLFSLVIYLAPRYYAKPGWWMFALMGFICGLIVLIRPTNILILLFLFLFNVTSFEDLKARFLFYWNNLSRFWIFPVVSFMLFIPQFLYWHYISGDYIFYSYGNQGFPFWNNPQILNVLFHIKGGWLLFTPLMYFTLIGLFIGSWRNQPNMRNILLVLILALYAFSSWWCWWFGGAFGYRSLVEFYTLLAFPFAYLTTRIFHQRWLTFKIIFIVILVILIHYNLELSREYDRLYQAHFNWRSWNESLRDIFPVIEK